MRRIIVRFSWVSVSWFITTISISGIAACPAAFGSGSFGGVSGWCRFGVVRNVSAKSYAWRISCISRVYSSTTCRNCSGSHILTESRVRVQIYCYKPISTSLSRSTRIGAVCRSCRRGSGSESPVVRSSRSGEVGLVGGSELPKGVGRIRRCGFSLCAAPSRVLFVSISGVGEYLGGVRC